MVFCVIHLQHGYRPYESKGPRQFVGKVKQMAEEVSLRKQLIDHLDMYVILRLPDSIKQKQDKGKWVNIRFR